MIVESQGVLSWACRLIKDYENALHSAPHDALVASEVLKNGVLQTPAWVSPLFLMIDLYQKAVVVSNRKSLLAKETDYQWKWFDINSGKWCPYSAVNNAVINKGFWDGETTVRITAGRRRYVINFNAMIQLNEETSNRRPITLWLKEKQLTKSETQPDTLPQPTTTSDSDNEAVFRPPENWSSPLNNGTRGRGKNWKKTPKLEQNDAESEKEMPFVRKRVELFQGLLSGEISDLIR